jgi:diguanylate cyclase
MPPTLFSNNGIRINKISMDSAQSIPTRRGIALSRRIYLARVIVLSLGFLSGGSAAYQVHMSALLWALSILQCFIWPHIAYWLESRSSQPYRSAMRTLLIDSVIVGFWVPVLHFNMLPSTAIVAMTAMSNVGVGGPSLLWRGTIAQLAGAAIAVLLTGFHWQPVSTQFNVLASLPLIALYPLAIGALTYQLSRRLSQQRDKLDYLSKHDGLSGLLNRMHWETLVAEELTRGQRQRTPAAIILVDIDFFKAVNDLAGHAAGDEVIRRFADLLRINVCEIDRVARYGGEEFAILLPNAMLSEAIDCAERLRLVLEQELLNGMRITASFGVAELRDEFTNASAWVQCADVALYGAKLGGRNRVITYSTIEGQTAEQKSGGQP